MNAKTFTNDGTEKQITPAPKKLVILAVAIAVLGLTAISAVGVSPLDSTPIASVKQEAGGS